MSYCVNCGVKLEQSLNTCPLCHTPVINPNEYIISSNNTLSPFAVTKGEVEPMNKHDVGMWLSIVLGSTALACGILNFLIFDHNRWSIPVIGACIIMWLFFCPRMFFPKIPIYINLIISALSVIFYEFSITLLTAKDRWFFDLVLPITFVILILTLLSGILYRFASKSLVATVLYFFIDVAFLCLAIERYVDNFIHSEIHLFWSVIVFSVCAVISIALISILSMARLRETVRKRFHF
ncbi:MAG: hypothetical protein IKW30_02430 [Lachnospiraceae bacterium]|nr:hypothetical protein [Lachnospiraceae bacterium]